MQELLDWMEYIEDDRQQRKIRHTLKDILVIVYSGSRLYAKSISQQSNISQGGENMKVIRNISAEDAAKKLEVSAAEKFVANETASSCLCRCSDG